MIVEFIGSSGAGKSTLIAEVRRRLEGQVAVTTPFEMLATPLGLGHVSHVTVRNLIQEIGGLPFFLAALPRHAPFVRYALRMLARQAKLSLFTLNNLRSLERKVAAHRLVSKRQGDRIVLVDEGPVLAAHNIFVYSDASYSRAEIVKFATLLPLPDLIIYVNAPLATLVDRSLQRANAPREMKNRDRAEIESYLCRAVALFDQLVALKPLRDRALVVENPDDRAGVCDEAADFVVETILSQSQPDWLLYL